MSDAALLGQLATTLPLAGLVLTVQLVHYPLFSAVGPSAFVDYHRRHSRRISWLVVPLMTVEAAAAAAWVVWSPSSITPRAPIAGAALVAMVWLSTALLQVPSHTRLARGFDPGAIRSLVATNWIRTLAWGSRSVLLVWAVAAG